MNLPALMTQLKEEETVTLSALDLSTSLHRKIAASMVLMTALCVISVRLSPMNTGTMLIALMIMLSVLLIKHLPLKQVRPINSKALGEFSLGNKFMPSLLLYAGLMVGIALTSVLIVLHSGLGIDVPSSLFALTLAPAIPCGITPLMLESKSWSYE